MRLDLVRAPAISLRYLTGKDRVTVVMIYPQGPGGRDTAAGRQTLPGEGRMNGFVYALLHKTR